MKRPLALAVALAVSVSCSAGKEKEASGRGGRAGRGNLSYPVEIMRVVPKRMPYMIGAPGTIEAFERVQVTARVAGAIDRVGFTEGQEVKKGDILVVIDSERFRLGVNSARAAVDKADASMRDSIAMVKRREGASQENPGLIPGEELESFRTKQLTARADREVAVQALRTAELNLRDSSVRAPIEGVIQTRTIETGQYVQAGYVMATLIRSDPLLLRFQVEPREAPRLTPGMAAAFTMRETMRKFTAKIRLVAAAADPATHMVSVTADVNDDGHKYWLRPGSFCDVSIEIDAQREAALIPRTAARATDHGYVAYVVEGGIARERVLTLGMNTKTGWVEVRSGLASGDMLVVRGAEALSSGAKVDATEVTAEAVEKSAPAAPSASPVASAEASAGPLDSAPAPSASPALSARPSP